MLSKERLQALPKKGINRQQTDAIYALAASLSCVLDAGGVSAKRRRETDPPGELEQRLKMIPGGLRDIRAAGALLEGVLAALLHTLEPDKMRSVNRQMDYLRIKTVFGPEASKDPEMYLMPIDDIGLLVHAATQECKMRMCAPGECARCMLGQVLDRTSFVSRDGRAWWEVLSKSARGEDPSNVREGE